MKASQNKRLELGHYRETRIRQFHNTMIVWANCRGHDGGSAHASITTANLDRLKAFYCDDSACRW